MTLTLGSLFSGIGGLELGMEWTGHFTTRWQVENDPYATRVLQKHWPEATRYGDITGIDWSAVEPVDLICGGFPCQPVSLAGHKLAQQDPRWLWPHFARAVRVLRPRYVLVENTPGLLSRGMGDVLRDLASLGYDAEWQSISAASAGAPHIRERVFVVAYTSGVRPSSYGEVFRRIPVENGFWAKSTRLRESHGHLWPIPTPEFLRMADGPPSELDAGRFRSSGNAVVPQVAQWIGEQIWRFHQEVSG